MWSIMKSSISLMLGSNLAGEEKRIIVDMDLYDYFSRNDYIQKRAEVPTRP